MVQNVSLPEELQKVLDTRIGMDMIGDMGRYTQYQVANSIPLAAQNEGGLAGHRRCGGRRPFHRPSDGPGNDPVRPAGASPRRSTSSRSSGSTPRAVIG